MKKFAVIIIVLSLLTLIVGVFYRLNSLELKSKLKTETNTTKTHLPLFEFTTLENTIFSKYDLDKNKATIIVYFDPDCGKCKIPANFFYTFKKAHKTIQVLFVSSNTIKKTKDYALEYKLDEVENVNFYIADFDYFYNTFKETNTPTYFIYNIKSKHLVTINDEVPAKILLRYIKVAQQ
ncbi:MAG TPA: hypothetical protein EYG89_00415 [Bacteroidia bacterium]|nr:hypothetical protein [Bacteroidia bacterium]